MDVIRSGVESAPERHRRAAIGVQSSADAEHRDRDRSSPWLDQQRRTVHRLHQGTT